MATASDTPLLTAEEFAALPGEGPPEELENGRIVTYPFRSTRHGQVCGEACCRVSSFIEDRKFGHVVCLGSGVITTRNPDSVRGPDLLIYPPGCLQGERVIPEGYHPTPPEVIFEVKSSDEPWSSMYRKVSEYLACGVVTVVVLDLRSESASIYTDDGPARILTADEDLALGGSLEGFRVRVGLFFE